MKKYLLALVAAAALVSAPAYALDLTLGGGHHAGTELNGGSVALGQQFGVVRGEVSLLSDRADPGNYVLGVSAALPVASVGPVALAAKAGVLYTDTGVGANGYGMKVGGEATYVLSKEVAAVVEVSHVRNEEALRGMNGNVGLVGLRFKF